MEYISKAKHKEAHELLYGLLQRNKEHQGGVYVGDFYEYLSDDVTDEHIKTRSALIDMLMEEQNGRCCYCMRHIENLPKHEQTIEHVIVNHPVDQNDYKQYLGKKSLLDFADMISSAEFLIRQLPPPPYPHSIAYENLLMSCAGHCFHDKGTSVTCNIYRGHKYIHPLPLMANVAHEVKYNKNGFVFWNKEIDTENPTVETLGLNNPVLILIRRIWYKIASLKVPIDKINRQVLVYEVLGDLLADGVDDATVQKLFLFDIHDWYWNLLMEFDYFNDISKFE